MIATSCKTSKGNGDDCEYLRACLKNPVNQGSSLDNNHDWPGSCNMIMKETVLSEKRFAQE